MDPALLRDRELFKKRALITPAVEKRTASSESSKKKKAKALGDQIVFVTRPDKKKILFYNDKSCQFTVDEEFQKLWRGVPVDSMDDEKIEEYLKRQGISSMQDSGPKKVIPMPKRKKSNSQKKRRFKTHNDHLAGVLKDYTDTPGKQ
ncbi:hypothetical protein FKM82_000935 [Ascaphus truei]